jgi:hypothetical protein
VTALEPSLNAHVRERAGHACEYCLLPESLYDARFQIDHIIAQQHGGKTVAGNLCLACPRCNASKGPNVASVDAVSGKIVKLYNPRRHKWSAHFRWEGARLEGRTAIGRVTIHVLAINRTSSLVMREVLIDEGVFKPRTTERRHDGTPGDTR